MMGDCACADPPAAGSSPAHAIAPGLSSFAYRLGTYGSFFAAMKARLSCADCGALAGLRTRASDDPAVALCDAWAIVADVLTFYQERIANEGYLRTASERSSVIELGRLVGYALRPGVAANVYLAYTIAQNTQATVDPGHRVQSTPPPGDLPQTFETAEPIDASDSWNTLPPRATRPQLITTDAATVYVDGVSNNLKKNDPVLLRANGLPVLRRIADVNVQSAQNRTLLTLQAAVDAPAAPPPPAASADSSFDRLVNLVTPLSKPPAAHPLNGVRLQRQIEATFTPTSDTTPAVLTALTPAIKPHLYEALQNAAVTPDPSGAVHALRVQAAPFGHNAPLRPILDEKGAVIGQEEWALAGSVAIQIVIDTSASDTEPGTRELRIGSLRLAATRRFPELGITVALGPTKASAAIALPRSQLIVPVGPWSVEITPNLDQSPPSIEFSFAKPITRDIQIAFLNSGEALEVTLDHGPDTIAVAHGQSSNTSRDGARTFVSYKQAVSVTDERALAPATKVIHLDALYDEIVPGSWVAVERPEFKLPLVTLVTQVKRTSISRYGLSGRVTELTLQDAWLDPKTDRTLASVRQATISAQSEDLTLAEEPIETDVAGQRIELGDLYGGLESGRWLIVQGERTDLPDTQGVTTSELVMLAGVEQDVSTLNGSEPLQAAASVTAAGSSAPVARPGDKTHSFLRLAAPLALTYKRDTVTVYGNVTRATQGETRVETLGSGNANAASQQFVLHIAPLTYVSAPTPDGVQGTLVVTVNDVPWNEIKTLATAGPLDHVYITSTNDQGTVTITFGDGVHGARLPTGTANIKARYRSGIGSAGNVDANVINLPVTRPAGVKAIVNPLPASGGTDPESRDEARRNAPIGVMALDRLVSVADYAAFARTFAGVTKAVADTLRVAGKSVIALTIAGQADGDIPDGSDLLVNLTSAVQQAGDARQRFTVVKRELVIVVAGVEVALADGYLWETVAVALRAALLNGFSFEQRALAQDVTRSEFLGVVYRVPGIARARLTQFDAIGQGDAATPATLAAKLAQIASGNSPRQAVRALPARIDAATGAVRGAQLGILCPDVADTLIITEALP